MSFNFTDINEIMDEFPDEDGTYESLKVYLNKIIKIGSVQNNDDGSGILNAASECLKIFNGGQVSNHDNDQKNKNVDIKLLIEALIKLQESFDAYMRGIAVVVNNSAYNLSIDDSVNPTELYNFKPIATVGDNPQLTNFNKAIDSWITATDTTTTTTTEPIAIGDDNPQLTDFNTAIDSWITATDTTTTTTEPIATVVDNSQLTAFNKAIDSWITATGTVASVVDDEG